MLVRFWGRILGFGGSRFWDGILGFSALRDFIVWRPCGVGLTLEFKERKKEMGF